MATRIDNFDELIESLRCIDDETVKRRTADHIAQTFGFPVFSHRDRDDDCPPNCYGGWPQEACRTTDPVPHTHTCSCGARWDERAATP